MSSPQELNSHQAMDLAAGLQGVVQQAAQLTVQEGDEQPQQEPPFQWHAAADPDPAVTAAVEAALAAGIDDVAMRAMSGQQYEPEELSKAFTQAMAGALDPDQQIWVHTDSDRLPSAAPAAAVAGSSDNSLQQQRRDRQALLQALSSCMPQTSDAVQAACANASYNERCHVLWSVGGGVGVLAGILNAKLSSPDAQSPAQN